MKTIKGEHYLPSFFCTTIDDNRLCDNFYKPIAESLSYGLKITKMGILRIRTPVTKKKFMKMTIIGIN